MRQGARRINVLAAGRRWRKSTLTMAIAVEAALGGAEILWGAPTYDQVRVGWTETRRACGDTVRFHEQQMLCTFPGNGLIRYRSLDNPDNARGHTADGVVIDEASYVNDTAWYEVIRPMLMTTNGWAWLIGTPRGRNWFFNEFTRAGDGTTPDAAAFNAPTLGVRIADGQLIREPHPLENPHIPFSEVEELYRTLSESSFRQEILAEFIEDGAGVFRHVRELSKYPMQDAPQRVIDDKGVEREHVYVAGIDWGMSNDFTAVSIWDATERRQAALYRWTSMSTPLQIARITELFKLWRWNDCLAEANSIGTPNLDYLIEEGVTARGFDTTNASKRRLIEQYALGFERRELGLVYDAVQVTEHEAYESERLPGGMLRYGAPDGMHDDTVIAGALAWSLARYESEALPVEDDADEEEPDYLRDNEKLIDAFPHLKVTLSRRAERVRIGGR